MPRFHFNVYDGSGLTDDEGCDFPDWSAARLDAVRLAGEFLRNNPKSALSCDAWRLEVADETGLVLFRLDFSLADAPAVKPTKSPSPLTGASSTQSA